LGTKPAMLKLAGEAAMMSCAQGIHRRHNKRLSCQPVPPHQYHPQRGCPLPACRITRLYCREAQQQSGSLAPILPHPSLLHLPKPIASSVAFCITTCDSQGFTAERHDDNQVCWHKSFHMVAYSIFRSVSHH